VERKMDDDRQGNSMENGTCSMTVKWKKIRILLGSLAVLSFSYYMLFVFTITYESFVDVNSGKIKKQTIIFGIVACQRTYPSRLSKMIEELGLQSKGKEEWIYIGGREEYLFFGVACWKCPTVGGRAYHSCVDLAKYLEVLEIPKKEKRKVAAEFLQLLKEKDWRRMDARLVKLKRSGNRRS